MKDVLLGPQVGLYAAEDSSARLIVRIGERAPGALYCRASVGNVWLHYFEFTNCR